MKFEVSRQAPADNKLTTDLYNTLIAENNLL